MRTVQPEFGFTEDDVKNLLMSRNFVYVDCYTLTAPNGDDIRCTNAQKDVIVVPIGGGVKQTWTSRGPKISGVKSITAIGVEVDEQEVVIDYDSSAMFQGIPLSRAFLWGRFDKGSITKDRYFAATWGGGNSPTVWMGGTRMYSGELSHLDMVGRSFCKFRCRSDLAKLNINVPTTLFQPSCRNALFDVGCKLNRNLFVEYGIVETGSTASEILWTGATDDMALGTIYMETDAGVTLIRTIRKVNAGVSLLLAYPFEVVPYVGQDFATYPGCNRSLTRCQEFSNEENFRGYPYIPTEETAL